jgi:hypothetical protein
MSAAPFDPSHPDTWPLVMSFAEVCAVLRIAPRTGYRLRQRHHFPVKEYEPRLTNTPQYSRDDLLQALKSRSGQATALERRQALSRVR